MEPHERKFLITELQRIELTNRSVFIKDIEIEQFHKDEYKYRHAEEWWLDENRKPVTKEYRVRYNRIGNNLYKHEITEDEWKELSAGHALINKDRSCRKDDEWDYDIDVFYEPKNFIMVEVSREGKNCMDFKAPLGWKEVTEDPKYKNSNIEKGSLDYEDLDPYSQT